MTDIEGRMRLTADPALIAALAGGDRSRRRQYDEVVVHSGSNAWGTVAFVALLVVIVGTFYYLSNGGTFYCDANCWQAKTDIALAEQTTNRAVANSNANRGAGFGNNDTTTGQTAVLPPARPAPVVVMAPAPSPAPAPVVYVVSAPPAPTYVPAPIVVPTPPTVAGAAIYGPRSIITRPGGGYVPGAPTNPAECVARGGTNTGRGCVGYDLSSATVPVPGGRSGYVFGAPTNPGECIARGGRNTGRGCEGYH